MHDFDCPRYEYDDDRDSSGPACTCGLAEDIARAFNVWFDEQVERGHFA